MWSFDAHFGGDDLAADGPARPSPGKRTLTMQLQPRPAEVRGLVQRKVALGTSPDEGAIGAAAARGVSTPAGALPHAGQVQAAFGRHRLDHVASHQGPGAAEACADMDAEAFATGDHIVFGGVPTLHTVAHEAAHVIQQRAGVARKGGGDDDRFERHADAVAERVVAGASAEGLLDELAPAAAPSTHVQRIIKVGKGGRALSKPALAVIAGSAELKKLHADKTKIYAFDSKAHLERVAGGEDAPEGVAVVNGKRKGRDQDVDEEDGGDKPAPSGKGKKTKAPESEEEEDTDLETEEEAKHKQKGKKPAPKAKSKGKAPAPDSDSDEELEAEPEHDEEEEDEEEAKEGPLPDGLQVLGLSDGPAMSRLAKGDTQMVRRPSFVRVNSRGQVGYVGNGMLRQQRSENVDNLKQATKRNPSSPNVINIALTVNYVDADGAPQAVAGIVPGFWNSGFLQADQAARPEIDPLTEEEAKLTASKQRGITESREKIAARQRLGAYFAGRSGEAGLNAAPGQGQGKKAKEKAKAKAEAAPAAEGAEGEGVEGEGAEQKAEAGPGAPMLADGFGALFAHSETMAVSDPGLPDRLLAQIKALLGGKKVAKLMSVTTDIDSFKNTVCFNACRPAVREIATMARTQLVAYATTNGIALSARFAGGARATSQRPFLPGKAMTEAHKAAPASFPLVLAGSPRMEMHPDARATKVASPNYDKLYGASLAATDVLVHGRGKCEEAVRGWLDGNKGHALVKALQAAPGPDEAAGVIGGTSSAQAASLLAAAQAPFGDRELDPNAEPAVLYLLWMVLAGIPAAPAKGKGKGKGGEPESKGMSDEEDEGGEEEEGES